MYGAGPDSGKRYVIDERVIRRILEPSGLWEECHAPPVGGSPKLEITFDPSYSQII